MQFQDDKAICHAAETLVADLWADKPVEIAEAVAVMASLKQSANRLFDRMKEIEVTEFAKHRPQGPGKAIPPEDFCPWAKRSSAWINCATRLRTYSQIRVLRIWTIWQLKLS